MNKTILQLTVDHHRLSELLTLFDEQMVALSNEYDFDFRLTEGIPDYIRNQPNVFHHPLEEFIFDRARRHYEIRPILDKLQHEHSTITIQTEECRAFFIHWRREGELFDCRRASEVGKAYVEFQRQHMEIEDREVFPFVIRNLPEADWKAIDDYANTASLNADPLFGPTVIEHYRNIRSDIQNKLG